MKILIVENQITTTIEMVEYLQKHLTLENSDIKIACNSSEAIFAVAKISELDLVLMNLKMPITDDFNAIEKISIRYPHVKIIIIANLQNDILVNKSINAGVKGYLLKKNIFTNLISVIQNVNDGYSVFPRYNTSNYTNLITDSNTKLQFANSGKLSKINKIIMANIINNWIGETKNSTFNINDFLQSFDVDFINSQNLINSIIQSDIIQCNLIQELELRFEQYIVKSDKSNEINRDNLDQKLEEIIENLNFWFRAEETKNTTFYGFTPRLEANAQVLRINYAKSLKRYIESIFLKSSPLPCLEHLESIELLLNRVAEEHQNELDRLMKQQDSAFKAYNRLIGIFYKSENIKCDHSQTAPLIRAILYIYRAKLQIIVSTLAIQIIQGLIRLLQFSIDDLILTINLLKTEYNKLNVSTLDEGISLFIRRKSNEFYDCLKLLEEIELDVGYSINQWGVRAEINPTLILDKLANKISIKSNDILKSIEQELSAS